MEEAKFVRVAHDGKSHLVALYSGLDPQELCSLLQAAFQLRQYVVGLVDHRRGIVVPISLACKAPQLLGEDTYSLILSGRKVSWERIQNSPAPPFTSSHNGATAEVREEMNEEKQDDDSGDKDEDTDDDIVKVDDDVRIVAFVRRMAGDGMVDEEGGNALESAAARGDSVVHTAFAAAVRSQDLDYLAALLKDIAVNNRRNNSTGRRLLEAKRIMLGMAESFRQAEEVDDDQLAFLQNLILVSNDDVMAAFRTYEQMRNPAYLAESLRKLCGAGQSVNDSQIADDHGADSAFASSASRNKKKAMKVTLLKVAINLACRGFIGAFEAKVVRKMISEENAVLMAAFKVYQEDGNMAELRDTVARAARIEAKRVIGESPSRRGTVGITRASTCPSPLPSDGAPSREFSFLLEGVLRQGVINPSDARMLFAAFEGRPIEGSSTNLRVLSNMVHAAWRMFKSSRDKQEVMELLCRIVRLSGNPAPSTTQDPSHSEAHANSGIVTRSIDHLLATKKVSLEEASCLASPSPAGRRVIFNALDVFQRDSSRETLLASLTIIAKTEMANRQGYVSETASQPLRRPQETRDDPSYGLGLGLDAPRAQQQTMDEDISLEKARMELMELVEHLSEERRVSVEEARRLTSYVKEGHPRVLAVYKEHVDSQSLIDALVSMVRPSGERTEAEEGDIETEESIGAEQRLWERVVVLMRETKVLDASDALRLLGLLSKKDPRTIEAFQAFDSSKDVSSLVSSVNDILNVAPAVSASTNLNAESLEPAAASPTVRDDMAKTVLGMVDDMGLDEQQVVALRRAISSGDANVDGALMVFKLDSDAKELKDTLARVARNAVERHRDVLVPRGEESREGFADVSQSRKDDDEATTFKTVLQHLCSVGGTSETQMHTIVRRYHEKDPLLLAALDVYKEEHDLSELVDTLKRLTRVTF